MDKKLNEWSGPAKFALPKGWYLKLFLLQLVMGVCFTVFVSSAIHDLRVASFRFLIAGAILAPTSFFIFKAVIRKMVKGSQVQRFVPEETIREDEYLVKIQNYVDGTIIGFDEGVLGMSDGLLYFAGNLCSFSLGARDLKECLPAPRAEDQENGRILEIIHPFCKLVLEILVLPESKREVSLATAIDTFIAEDKATDQPCSYPPIRRNWIASSDELNQRSGR